MDSTTTTTTTTTTITSEEPKLRTITLTGRPPVTIREDDWPVIAVARDDSWQRGGDSARYDQAKAQGELDTWSIRVRQHADGRAIVYAILDGATAWTRTEDRRGGEILGAGSDLAAAISRVGRDVGIPDATIRDCIADLPAEILE